jgi:hypothetical protein
MKRQTKLDSTGQQLGAGAELQSRNSSAMEFSSPEEMLRYDATQTPVPDRIVQRLQKSAEGIPPPATPWWRRLFRRSS